MKKLLQSLRLIDYLTVTVPASRPAFIDKLSAIVETGDAAPFSSEVANLFDKRRWFGKVNIKGFKIRMKKGMFERGTDEVATGTFVEENKQLFIETEIRGNVFFLCLLSSFQHCDSHIPGCCFRTI